MDESKLQTEQQSISPTITTHGGEKHVIPLQLSLLKDCLGKTVQERFEEFCEDAVHQLSLTNSMGNLIHEPTKVASEITIKLKLSRLSEGSLTFQTVHEIKAKHPHVPGQIKDAMYVGDHGLVQKASPEQFPLFDPNHGQAEPASIEEAAELLDED